jgi:FtsZ-interacting cell division protein ZipA
LSNREGYIKCVILLAEVSWFFKRTQKEVFRKSNLKGNQVSIKEKYQIHIAEKEIIRKSQNHNVRRMPQNITRIPQNKISPKALQNNGSIVKLKQLLNIPIIVLSANIVDG